MTTGPDIETQLKKTKLHTFPQLIEALGGAEAVLALPELDIGGRMGPTGYLDFLPVKDVTAPLMRGIDAYGRPFVTVCYRHHDETIVECLFQRCVDNVNIWTSGHHKDFRLVCVGSQIIMNAGHTPQNTLMCAFQMDRLRRLVQGKEVAATLFQIGLGSEKAPMETVAMHNPKVQIPALKELGVKCYEPNHGVENCAFVSLCDPCAT